MFVADIVSIITYMNSVGGDNGIWLAALTTLILGPLALGYLHSIVSWWGGKA